MLGSASVIPHTSDRPALVHQREQLAKMLKPMLKILAGAVLLTAPLAPAAAAAEAIEAAREDVESIDAIMTAIYDVISGPAGAPRDWDRFRSLFHEGARLIPVGANGATAITPEEYVTRAGASFAENGFFESEIGRKTDRYGDIVHIFSAYEGKRNADDAEPFLRGVNSFQLLRHKGRWWIVTIYWQAETPDNPIPEAYLQAQ